MARGASLAGTRASFGSEALARRTIFACLRTAALELWGPEGLEACATRLSIDAREHCVDAITIAEEWLPERFVLEWFIAAWEGPAERDRTAYNRWLQAMMDAGFGRVRKALLRLASARQIIAKSAALWSHDHSTGTLEHYFTSPHSATVTLRDHVYVDTPLARASIAEIFRYAAALSRSPLVRGSHSPGAGRSVTVLLTWEDE